MWKNSGLSLEDMGQELPQLRENLERVFPGYVASLKRVSRMPVEFGRRWRASWVAEHLYKVTQNCQQFVNQGAIAGLFGGMAVNIALNLASAVTKQPREAIPPVPALDFAIAIWPSGDARPTLRSMSPRQAGVVTVSFEDFERAALKLRNDVLSGELVPLDKAEVPRLIYQDLAEGKPGL
ncbi:hypothetical protein ACFLXC_01550 [Chloroflexota bacterium]